MSKDIKPELDLEDIERQLQRIYTMAEILTKSPTIKFNKDGNKIIDIKPE